MCNFLLKLPSRCYGMALHKLNLAWDKFNDFTLKTFRELWNNETFTDVILVTEGDQQIKAHKAILCSASSFFKCLFEENPYILKYEIEDLSNRELSMILEFIYMEQFSVKEDELDTFLAAGKLLAVEGLLEDTRPINITVVDDDINEDMQETKQDSVEISKMQLDDSKGKQCCCTICDFQTYKKLYFKKHLQNEHGDIPIENLECDMCEYKASKRSHLKRHIKETKHSEFSCTQCNFKAALKKYLIKHSQLNHTIGNNKLYGCDTCDFVSAHKSHLKRHNLAKHGELNLYCNQCDYKTSIDQYMNYHKRTKHINI